MTPYSFRPSDFSRKNIYFRESAIAPFVRPDSSRDGALTRGEEGLKARQKFSLLTLREKGLRCQLQVEIFFPTCPDCRRLKPLLFPPPIPLFLSSFSVRLSNLFLPLFQKRGRRKVEDVLIGPDWKYFSRGPFFVRLAAETSFQLSCETKWIFHRGKAS